MFYVSPEKQNHKQGFSKVMRDSAKTFLKKKNPPSQCQLWKSGTKVLMIIQQVRDMQLNTRLVNCKSSTTKPRN